MLRRQLLIQKLFESKNFNSVLNWSNTGFEERIVNFIANSKNIPIVYLQHSIIIDAKRFDKFLPFHPILPLDNACGAMWGDLLKQYLIDKNVEKSQFFISGSPRHDPFFNSRKKNSNEGTIILAFSASAFIYNTAGNDTRSLEKLEELLKEIIRVVKQFPSKKLIVKLHPSKAYYDIQSFVNRLDPSIPVYKDQNPLPLLASADLVISNTISTILLESMILGKPTMCIVHQNQNHQEESIVKNNATFFVSEIEDIEPALKKILTNDKFRNSLIQNGTNYINQYFSHQGSSSKFLSEKLGSM